MTTFRQEALPEIDTTNPLGIATAFACLPLADSGTDVVNVVTSESYPDTGNSYTSNGLRGDGTRTNLDSIAPDFYNESFIFMVDLKLGDLSPNSGGSENLIFNVNTNHSDEGFGIGYYIHYSTGRGGISHRARLNYYGADMFEHASIKEGEWRNARGLLAWDHVAKNAKFYADGVLIRSTTISSFDRTFNSFRFTLPFTNNGDSTSALKSAAYLKRSTPFTTEEVVSLAQDPYQIFRTAEDESNDRALRLKRSGTQAIVALDYPAPANVFIEVDVTIYSATTEYPAVQIGLFHDATGAYKYGFSFTSTNRIRVQARDSSESYAGTWTAGERMTLRLQRSGQTSSDDWVRSDFYKNGVNIGTAGSGKPTFTFNDFRVAYGSDIDCKVHSFRYEDSNGNKHYWDCNRSTGVPIDLIGDKVCTLSGFSGDEGWEYVNPTSVYDSGDYSTLSALSTAQASNNNHVKYTNTSSVGASISGFSNSLTIEGGEITSTLTLTTTGDTFINSVTAGDIDATGAAAVYIEDCEVGNVTG